MEHFQNHHPESLGCLALFCLKGLFICCSLPLGNLPAGMKLEFAKLWVCCLVLKGPEIPALTENGQGDFRNEKAWPWNESSAAGSLLCADNSCKVLITYTLNKVNTQYVVAIIVAAVKSPALNKVPGTKTHLINSGYCYDWYQVCLLHLWREEWGCYLGQLLQAEITNGQDEAWVCGFQTMLANLLSNSSKIPITEN